MPYPYRLRDTVADLARPLCKICQSGGVSAVVVVRTVVSGRFGQGEVARQLDVRIMVRISSGEPGVFVGAPRAESIIIAL